MSQKSGSLSIHSENIFPIIKKWLYSDQDIFIRELVSNGSDAITKLNKLEMIGEYTYPEKYKARIDVIVNPDEKTIAFQDNGIGMDFEELDEYINQIAFSGAADFLEKYKDKTNNDQIIGHFGLGFYSAFMVASEVHIDTLSYKEGATPVHWECDGGTEFTMSEGERQEVGTTITLYLGEDHLEFANEFKVREVIEKYCSFMPVEIYLTKANKETEYETINADEVTEDDTVIETFTEEAKTEEKEQEDGSKEIVEVSPAVEKAKIVKRPVSLNDTKPLWTLHPNECNEEDYKKFYRKVFNDYKEPLFWIHLNMDYPFNLKGIIYFPRINTEYESAEGVIKLYNNQVFIADNIKEVIPEFLLVLKGVIDCPDLPLNVSRSALQNDGFVTKISDYIAKKVADKLTGMCKTDRETYEKYWNDIHPFIKYGCLKDDKFCEKIKDYILYQDLSGRYMTLDEYIKSLAPETDDKKADEKDADTENSIDSKEETPSETENTDGAEKVVDAEADVETDAETEKTEAAEAIEETDDQAIPAEGEDEKEPEKTAIYYVTDEVLQSQYINMFKEAGLDAVLLTHNIDSPFISMMEQKNEQLQFKRIDADVTSAISDSDSTDAEKENSEQLSEIFKKALGQEGLEVKAEKLKNSTISSILTLSEESRRMQDMMAMYGMKDFGNAGGETLVLNTSNTLVQYILNNPESEHVSLICEQLYDLAKIGNQPLTSDQMTRFIQRSNEIMMLIAK